MTEKIKKLIDSYEKWLEMTKINKNYGGLSEFTLGQVNMLEEIIENLNEIMENYDKQ